MITFNLSHNLANTKNYATVNEWLYAKQIIDSEHFNTLSNVNSLGLLQEKIQYKFKNLSFLIRALTHKTFFYENKKFVEDDNEKFEFIGDSLMNFIIGKNLYLKFSQKSEGDLSKLRNSLVNESSFANLARSIALSNNLLVGRGELKNLGFEKDSLLSNALEALVAAVYFDSNDLVSVEKVVNQIIANYELEMNEEFYELSSLDFFDSKSNLQEFTMKKWQTIPEYKSVQINIDEFKVELIINNEVMASMTGSSKKKIEKELAKKILEELSEKLKKGE